MPGMSPTMMAPIAIAMMVAMMLPSLAPAIWRYHRHLRAAGAPHAARRAALCGAGYLCVWTVTGFVLWGASRLFPSLGISSEAGRPSPWPAGVLLVSAGLVQCSAWKAKQLARCRVATALRTATSRRIAAAYRDGAALGLHCSLSCAAPMAPLLVSGLMDARMMLLVTLAITAERVAPAGMRIAHATGALTLVAASAIWLRV